MLMATVLGEAVLHSMMLRRRLDDTSADVRQFSDVFVFLGLLHFDEFEDDVGMFLSDLQQALRRS
jgi:hypothetical protein